MRAPGKARASAVSSGICGWYSQASNVRSIAASFAKPSRKAAVPISSAGAGLPGFSSTGSASQAVMWRMPRNRSPPARRCASSTASTRAPNARFAWPTMPAQMRRGAVAARGAHRRDAVDEFRLADRAQFLRPVRAMEGAALDEHGIGDVVAAVEVGQQIVQQVAPAAAVPQMMVRIDDRQVRLQRRLDGAGEPVLADGKVVRRALGGAAHVTILRDRPMLAA